ncbi:MAG: phosphatase PAP2 family protein [Candidatus Bilamarchaeaceae archaeon]
MDLLMQIIAFFSILLSNEFVFFAVVGGMVVFTEKRKEKRIKILLAVALASILVIGLKMFFAVPRPCESTGGIIECPASLFFNYSFPSGHATIAFLIMIAFLDKPSFPFYWLFAFFVAYSRIFLGVHNFEDIAGALVLAPIAYYLTDLLWVRLHG